MTGYNLPDNVSASDPDAPWNKEYDEGEEETNLLDETLARDPDPPDGLARILELGADYLDAETANKRIIALECKLIRLQAELDEVKLRSNYE